ncbi:MAG: hypothetical protein ACQER9_03675 [Nanobdellota archaeon]
MAGLIEKGVLFLHELGFFTVFLPFIIFYVIIYAMLNKTNILGKGNNNYNTVFAFSLSFLAIYQLDMQENFAFLISRFAILIIMIVILIMISSFLESDKHYSKSITIFLVLAYVIYILIDSFFNIFELYEFLSSKIPVDIILPVIIALAIFFSIIWFILKPEKQKISPNSQKENNNEPVQKKSSDQNVKSESPFDLSNAQNARDFVEKSGGEKVR